MFALCAIERCEVASCFCFKAKCIGLPWINMTYVSHQWRETALSCPTLWAGSTFGLALRIPFLWTKTLINRSSNLPISLSLDHRYLTEYNRLRATLARYIDRVQDLSIYNAGERSIDSGFQELDAPVPHLEKLTVFLSRNHHRSFLFPVDIFACDSPQLRTLHASGFLFIDGAFPPAFTNLTSLTLTRPNFVHRTESNTVSVAQLKSQLSNMTRLQYLSISDYMNLFLVDITCVARTTLPSLTSLEFRESSWKHFICFFEAFAFPALSSLSLGLYKPFGRGTDNADAYAFASHYIGSSIPALSAPFTCLDIKESASLPYQAGWDDSEQMFDVSIHATLYMTTSSATAAVGRFSASSLSLPVRRPQTSESSSPPPCFQFGFDFPPWPSMDAVLEEEKETLVFIFKGLSLHEHVKEMNVRLLNPNSPNLVKQEIWEEACAEMKAVRLEKVNVQIARGNTVIEEGNETERDREELIERAILRAVKPGAST